MAKQCKSPKPRGGYKHSSRAAKWRAVNAQLTHDEIMHKTLRWMQRTDTMHKVVEWISSEFNKQFADFVTEGLKRKGFEFKNRYELISFMKKNCRCEDRKDVKERIYIVNNTPFLLHKYEIPTSFNSIVEGGSITIRAIHGYFYYL